METETPPSSEPGIATLVGGILQDGELLLKQQLQMFRSEVKQELGHLRSGMVSLCIGAGIAAIGVVFLAAMLSHVLFAFTEIPLWGCYGVVGGALCVVGAAIAVAGRRSVSHVRLAPPPKTARAIKENVEWVTTRKMRNGTR